jgi:proteasome lid subunit RPN8/RPN11
MAKKRIVDLIVEHSLELYPIEACGILIGEKRGSVKLIQKVYKTRNVFNTPSRYKISPEDQLTAFSEAEKEGKEVLGFYHSHPYWEAKPSTFDISVAFYEGLSYVIYSIPTRSIASYIWEGGNFILEEVKII